MLVTAMPISVSPRLRMTGRASSSSVRAASRIVSCAEVARRSVCERVARLKSPKRRRRTTVRPILRPLRIRRVTRSTTSARITSGSVFDPPGKRGLRTDRAPAAIGSHPAGVAAVRDGVQVMGGVVADGGRKRGYGHDGNLADRSHPELVQRPRGRWTDAPEALDGQRFDEGPFAIARNDQDAIRLGRPARHLRQGLRPRAADRDREADLGSCLVAQARRDLPWRAEDSLEPGHVEKRLLHREALDHRGAAAKDLEELAAGLDVGIEAGGDGDQAGAQLARAATVHAAMDPVAARLVARSHHHALANYQGLVAKRRVVALLDRREEGVGVRVKDGRPVVCQANICSHACLVAAS